MKLKILKVTKKEGQLSVVCDLEGEERKMILQPHTASVEEVKKIAKYLMEKEGGKKKGFVNFDKIKELEGKELCLDKLKGIKGSCC